MRLDNQETVRRYWDASARFDYEGAGKCVAPGYVWIDHTTGVVARTADELLAAAAEDAAWSDRTFEITNMLETTGGALVVQARISGTLVGTWRSHKGRGERVSSDSCTIFRFDDEGRISSEEHYSDALTLLEQLNSHAADAE
jgi:ketosteroid isomerase-like protein